MISLPLKGIVQNIHAQTGKDLVLIDVCWVVWVQRVEAVIEGKSLGVFPEMKNPNHDVSILTTNKYGPDAVIPGKLMRFGTNLCLIHKNIVGKEIEGSGRNHDRNAKKDHFLLAKKKVREKLSGEFRRVMVLL